MLACRATSIRNPPCIRSLKRFQGLLPLINHVFLSLYCDLVLSPCFTSNLFFGPYTNVSQDNLRQLPSPDESTTPKTEKVPMLFYALPTWSPFCGCFLVVRSLLPSSMRLLLSTHSWSDGLAPHTADISSHFGHCARTMCSFCFAAMSCDSRTSSFMTSSRFRCNTNMSAVSRGHDREAQPLMWRHITFSRSLDKLGISLALRYG
ncbi:hypothetical protein BJ546DRAFT_664175 [Cryomyces antarcticus]